MEESPVARRPKPVNAVRALLALIPVLCLGCSPPGEVADTIELRPDTYLTIYRTVESGFLEASVHTSMSIRWPHSIWRDNIGEVNYYNRNEDIRLLEPEGWYVLVYGEWLLYRPTRGGRWRKWKVRNSGITPPPASVASYLRDWLAKHRPDDFACIPDSSQVDLSAPPLFEEIRWFDTTDGQEVVFGSDTRWTLPYRLTSFDLEENALCFETRRSGLPRFIVFKGVPGHFGGWFFDPDATGMTNGTPYTGPKAPERSPGDFFEGKVNCRRP